MTFRHDSRIPAVLRQWYGSRLALIGQSILIGLIAGTVVVGFRLLLEHADLLRSQTYRYLRTSSPWLFLAWAAVLAVLGLFLGWMSAHRPMIRGSGIPQIKGVLLRKFTLDWARELPMKIVAGVLGIGAGLSLGREGPSVQIGAYVGKGVLSVARRPAIERKYLLTAGASAGLAAAFNAPLAGVIFALEELHRSFSPLLLACAMGASMAADMVAGSVFGLGPVFDFKFVDPLPLERFPWIALLGILCAFLGDVFKRSLYLSQDLYGRLRIPQAARPVLPLLVSIPLGLYLFEATGGGHPLIESLSHTEKALGSIALLLGVKLVFTALSYGSGTAGGIFLPLLVCGALLGDGFGKILAAAGYAGADQSLNFMILGMAAFFTAVVKAPVTGAVLILEMSGNFNHLGGLVLACLAAFVASDLLGSRAVYEVLLERLFSGPDPSRGRRRHRGATVVEVPVGSSSLLAHRLVRSVQWPPGCLVVGIGRGEEDLVPSGNTEIFPGDRLAVLMNDENAYRNKEALLALGEDRK